MARDCSSESRAFEKESSNRRTKIKIANKQMNHDAGSLEFKVATQRAGAIALLSFCARAAKSAAYTQTAWRHSSEAKPVETGGPAMPSQTVLGTSRSKYVRLASGRLVKREIHMPPGSYWRHGMSCARCCCGHPPPPPYGTPWIPKAHWPQTRSTTKNACRRNIGTNWELQRRKEKERVCFFHVHSFCIPLFPFSQEPCCIELSSSTRWHRAFTSLHRV